VKEARSLAASVVPDFAKKPHARAVFANYIIALDKLEQTMYTSPGIQLFLMHGNSGECALSSLALATKPGRPTHRAGQIL